MPHRGVCSGNLQKAQYPEINDKLPALKGAFQNIDVCNARESVRLLQEDDPTMLVINAGDRKCNLSGYNVIHKNDIHSHQGKEHNCAIYSNDSGGIDFLIAEREWVNRQCKNVALLRDGVAGLKRDFAFAPECHRYWST